jgi:TPR repeat protein
MAMAQYYSCCGKSICGGCVHSFRESGIIGKRPFCNERTFDKTCEELFEELMKRVEVNDAGATFALGNCYCRGQIGLQQNEEKAIELFTKSAESGCSDAHCNLGNIYREGGYLKKASFHYEAAAMAEHKIARHSIGCMELHSGDKEQVLKHWIIAASAGSFRAMHNLLVALNEGGLVGMLSTQLWQLTIILVLR